MPRRGAKIEFEETKIGRLDHKIAKLQIIKLVPGVDWLRSRMAAAGITASAAGRIHAVRRGRGGDAEHAFDPDLERHDIVNIVAAGNAVVFNAHPSAARLRGDGRRARLQ